MTGRRTLRLRGSTADINYCLIGHIIIIIAMFICSYKLEFVMYVYECIFVGAVWLCIITMLVSLFTILPNACVFLSHFMVSFLFLKPPPPPHTPTHTVTHTADRLQAGVIGACSLANLLRFEELQAQQRWQFTVEPGFYPERRRWNITADYFHEYGSMFYNSILLLWYDHLNSSLDGFLVSGLCVSVCVCPIIYTCLAVLCMCIDVLA